MASRSLAPTSRSASRSGSRYRTPALLDPFRLMNSLLTDVVGTRPSDGNGNDLLLAQPRMNIDDTGKEIRVTAELPGVKKEDIHVAIDGAQVTLEAEVKREKEASKDERTPFTNRLSL